MIAFKRWKMLAGGLGLITAINAFALGGAWYNRQGEPDSVLMLTERELSRIGGRAGSENSGLALRLHWEMPEDDHARQAFTEAQMLRAGFTHSTRACRQRTERDVFVALELDGPAYRQALADKEQKLESARKALAAAPSDPRHVSAVENAERNLRWTRNRSRLFAVDIDRDREALRQRWADRTRYAIVRGRVRPGFGCGELVGHLTGLAVDQIQAPRPFHAALAELPQSYWHNDEPFDPHYRLEIAFGQRLEPWLRKVERVDATP